MENNNEQWKPVINFEENYSVSSLGKVRRETLTRGFGSMAAIGRVMQQKKCTNGYRTVSLYPRSGKQKQLLVHRLVALAFVPNPENKPQVNHKNGIKHDNRIENLEWMTCSDNLKHAYESGLARGKSGESNPMAKLNRDTAEAVRALHGLGWNKSKIARALRIDTSRVLKIVRNEIWKP